MVDFNRLIFTQEAVKYPDPYANIFELGAYAFGDEQGSMGRLFGIQPERMITGGSVSLDHYNVTLLAFLD